MCGSHLIRRRSSLIALALCAVGGWVQAFALNHSSGSDGGVAPHQITERVLSEVVQAIEDEIYDYKREKLFSEVDDNPGGSNSPAVISVYISKELDGDVGVALYKYMPFGEVYRYFVVREDGLVSLSGEPWGGFLPHGGSMQTVYMKAETVCEFISSESIKTTFTVNPHVSEDRIRLAVTRQLQRTGYSYRLDNSDVDTHMKTKTKRKGSNSK